MTRHLSLVAIVLCLTPSLASAQGTEFTVKVQTADVRKAPSTGSPIVGQAPRGATLEVTRDIGAWVKVAWPEAPDGVGYVHQSMGTVAQRASREERLTTTFANLPPPEPEASPALAAAQSAQSIDASASTRTIYVPPPTHFVGLGGQMSGSNPGFGFTSRVWSRRRLGVQLDSVAVPTDERHVHRACPVDTVRAEPDLLVDRLRRRQPVAPAVPWRRRRDDAVQAG